MKQAKNIIKPVADLEELVGLLTKAKRLLKLKLVKKKNGLILQDCAQFTGSLLVS